MPIRVKLLSTMKDLMEDMFNKISALNSPNSQKSTSKLQSITDFVQSATKESVVYLRTVEGTPTLTTAWPLAANIATNQFNDFKYKHLPSVFLVIIYLL